MGNKFLLYNTVHKTDVCWAVAFGLSSGDGAVVLAERTWATEGAVTFSVLDTFHFSSSCLFCYGIAHIFVCNRKEEGETPGMENYYHVCFYCLR